MWLENFKRKWGISSAWDWASMGILVWMYVGFAITVALTVAGIIMLVTGNL